MPAADQLLIALNEQSDRKKKLRQELEENVRKAAKEGLSVKAISKRFNLSLPRVYKLAKGLLPKRIGTAIPSDGNIPRRGLNQRMRDERKEDVSGLDSKELLFRLDAGLRQMEYKYSVREAVIP